MDKLLDKFVTGKRCFLEVLQNSGPLHAVLETNVAELADDETIGGIVHNVGMAKHRYSSIVKRLGRLVSKVLAILKTAETVRIKRAGKPEGKVAEQFLEELNEEGLIQLAMMADAADEAYILTCFMDDSDYDLSIQADEVMAFTDNCVYLFDTGGCVAPGLSGYTNFILKFLERQRVLNTAKVLLFAPDYLLLFTQ